jgi:hypothetical protein
MGQARTWRGLPNTGLANGTGGHMEDAERLGGTPYKTPILSTNTFSRTRSGPLT